MKLSISAQITDEDATAIAIAKGWSEKVTLSRQLEDGTMQIYEGDNTQTAADFLISVYQSIITNDVTSVLTNIRTQELKEQMMQAEINIRTAVENSITSSIE